MTKWLDNPIRDDVVVSTRLRVARNLKDKVFPIYANQLQANEVKELIKDSVFNLFQDGEYSYHELVELEPREKMRYMEDHLISPILVDHWKKSSFFLRDDEKVTIMINEEDHIRLQTLLPGLDLIEGWKLCSEIDDILESSLDFAWHEEYGYLTSCPTNAGTGLRASVMLHLPGVSFTGHISNIIDALRKIGLTIRGIYGEGTEAVGHLYQVSNQLTLGESEDEIIEKLNRVVLQLMRREKNTREYLADKKRLEIEDKVYRSLGILRSARLIASKEAMEMISNIKLGRDLGMIDNEQWEDLIKLMIDIKPGNIQNRVGRSMNRVERDQTRADIVRDYFK